MFKRIVTVITMIATSSLFLNEAALAGHFALSPTPRLIKERKGACLPCAAARGNSETDPIDSLAALGRRTQIHPLTPLERSLFDGTMVNLVSTSTGHLAFAITDLEITGEMPILFQRAYSSDNGEDRGLGPGWSFVFDDRITLGRDGATLSTGVGSVINFQRAGQSQRFILKTDEPNVHQAFDILDANTVVERAGGLARTYKRLGQSYHLQQIADPDGNTITLSFNSREKVSRIAGSGAASLTLEWSDEKDPRLLAVTDQSHHRVAFEQEGGRLRRVTDAAGAQWAYDYQGGRLVLALDPAGRVLLRARYDRAGRVVEAGDGAGTNLYEYDSAANDYARRTVVTGPEGAKATFEQTERGALSAIRDDAGEAVLGIDYNSANRPTRIADPLNGDTVFSYDAQNRLVNRASSDGSFQTYTYDERGQVSSTTTNAGRTEYERDERGDLTRAKSDGPAQSYRVTRNSRGQAVSVKSEAGSEISLEYDATGNAAAFSTNRAGRFETGTDATGRVISRSLPSGALYRYEYDPRGMLLKQSDNRGHAVTFERESSGALTGVLMASGKWIRATRDEAGRIVTLSTSAGKSRRFAYDARGALTDYTDARGRRKHFSYDKRGRLESVEDTDGHHTVVERDLKGRVKRVWSFNLPKGKPDLRDARAVALLERPSVERFTQASYGTDPLRLLSPQSMDCLFDPSDAFMDPELMFQGFGCNDPFGGFGSDPYSGYGGGGYGFDPFFDPYLDPTTGTCAECTARQLIICATRERACVTKAEQSTLWTGIGCLGITLVNAVGGIICAGLLLGGLGTGSIACHLEFEACLLESVDKCPQCG